MALTLPDELAARAAELLKDWQREVIFRPRNPGTYDPSTSSAAISGEAAVIEGALLSYSVREMAGGVGRVGGRKFFARASAFPEQPQTGDRIEADGITWAVQAVEPRECQGVRFAYVLHLGAA